MRLLHTGTAGVDSRLPGPHRTPKPRSDHGASQRSSLPLYGLRQHHRSHRVPGMSAHGRAFGHGRRRREDAPLLRGTAQYLADLIEPGMAVMRVIRSKHAHARVTRIDFGAAAREE